MIDPLHATIEEFRPAHARRVPLPDMKPLKWRPRISMGLTLAQLSERLVRRDGSLRQAVADGKHARQAAGAEGLGSNPNGPIAD